MFGAHCSLMVAHSSLLTEVVFIVFHFIAGAKVYSGSSLSGTRFQWSQSWAVYSLERVDTRSSAFSVVRSPIQFNIVLHVLLISSPRVTSGYSRPAAASLSIWHLQLIRQHRQPWLAGY